MAAILNNPGRTLCESSSPVDSKIATQTCCLVQIYPADVVDGMLRLDKDRLVIGRDQSSDLWLQNASVSRQHAELRRVENGFEIVDLQSTNGTIVNGERIKKRHLRSGNDVKIGTFLFRFLEADTIESAYHQTVYNALTIDALTGAFNKTYLLDNLAREIARSQRHGRPLAVIMVDIDWFKVINDTHGHLVGDEVLREFGHRMEQACRDGDLFARYGGEEFCLLLTETESTAAVEVAERCRRAIESDPFMTEAGRVPITASFGVKVLTEAAETTPSDLIGAADEQLYAAKSAGRNCVRLAPPVKS